MFTRYSPESLKYPCQDTISVIHCTTQEEKENRRDKIIYTNIPLNTLYSIIVVKSCYYVNHHLLYLTDELYYR